ncbi:hypothetical protein B0H10DRAFT_2202646 [Mycena sp. CBHHK59/15]|nr:hypothetical protein B0H10DRAFT_2202646 [Mycena sp. CBHHK59/15]
MGSRPKYIALTRANEENRPEAVQTVPRDSTRPDAKIRDILVEIFEPEMTERGIQGGLKRFILVTHPSHSNGSPHRRTAEPDPTPPAPAGNLPRVTRRQALPPDLTPPNPVAPSHAARGSQRNTVTAQGEPAPPARASGSSEQARGFALLTSLPTNRGSGSRNQPGIRSAASQNHNQLLTHIHGRQCIGTTDSRSHCGKPAFVPIKPAVSDG